MATDKIHDDKLCSCYKIYCKHNPYPRCSILIVSDWAMDWSKFFCALRVKRCGECSKAINLINKYKRF